MRDDERRGGKGRPRRSRPRYDDDDLRDDERGGYDDEAPDEAPPRRRRPPAPRGGGRRRPAPARRSEGFLSSLFGGGGGDRRRRRARSQDEDFDWDYAQDEREYGDADEPSGAFTGESWDDERRERGRRPGRGRKPERLTLMDLCNPVFAYAAMLPRDPGGMHPSYDQFREQVLTALQRVESEGPNHGIDREDAAEAVYACCLFLDEQVQDSEWTGKLQWSAEPLHIVKLGDPEGGINFFRRLDALGERHREVKEIFLVCLAMGYRGRYAELEPTEQVARIGEIRQKIVRSIYPRPVDSQEVLFPEAYEPPAPLEDDVPPPPRWWWGASLGAVAVSLLLWGILLWAALVAADEPAETLRGVSVTAVEAASGEVAS